MAWTADDVATLERSMADGRGAKTVVFGDQQVVFYDMDEQRALLAEMRRQVAAAQGRPTTRYAQTSKGC